MTDLSIDAALVGRRGESRLDLNGRAVAIAALALVAGAIPPGIDYGWGQGAPFPVGAGLGVSLYHALFEFTPAVRLDGQEKRALTFSNGG